MIKLSGHDDGSDEWRAARVLRDKILGEYPAIAENARQRVYIFPSVQTPFCSDCKNVDLYMLAKFEDPLFFNTLENEVARCYSLSATFEVKAHAPPAVWLEGDNVWVQYDGGPSPATAQAYRQPFAIKKYFQRKKLDPPYIDDFVFLSQCTADEFGHPYYELPLELILSDTSFSRILAQSLMRKEGAQDLRHFGRAFDFDAAAESLSRILVPSKLARDRIEAITTSRYKHRALAKLGTAQVSLAGYGGAGKTAIMLRASKDLYERGFRTLVLTYHTALTSDLYRQLQVMGLRQTAFGHSVNVDTLHSFFRRWLVDLQEVDAQDIDDRWFEDSYYRALRTANTKISQGHITQAELTFIREQSPASYDYSYVMIDEAQDWHDEERDFLYNICSPDRLLISLGHRQLIRSDHPCNWTPPPPHTNETAHLKKCLRLKPNLAAFVNAIASKCGDRHFRIESDSQLTGGEVHIAVGSIANRMQLVKQLLSSNSALGVENVDNLFCVTQDQVYSDGGLRQSQLGVALREAGYSVYDAVDRELRMGIPSSQDDLRILQYDSCRGLEGWVVGLDLLDSFFEIKRTQALTTLRTTSTLEFLAEGLAAARALEWLLIPLTRAVDTLLIGIANPSSPLGSIVMSAADDLKDFVRVHPLEDALAAARQ